VFGVLIPVGPDPRDLRRLRLLVAELEHYEERGQIKLLVIDDAPSPRALEISWPDQVVIRTPAWSGGRRPDVLTAHVSGTLAGLRRAGDLDFVLKLDTDSAIIGRFSDQIADAFTRPDLGIVGSYDRTGDGEIRDWSGWKRPIDRATWPVYLARSQGTLRIRRRSHAHRQTIRQIRDAAYRRAPPGAHCLGGAYAVSRNFLASAALEPDPWLGTRLGEDVVVGLLSSHAGLAMASLTAPGEPFALAWQGLPGTPAELKSRGHSIVHSVKHADPSAEETFRRELHQSERVDPFAGL
jgi:hypothetical protein